MKSLAGVAGHDAFERLGLPQHDAVKEPKRTDDLIHVRPGTLLADEVQLVGAHLLEMQPIRRRMKMPAELRDRVEVGLLRCWRKIADRHVLDHHHPLAKRAHRSHRGLLSREGWV
jgi:hypothetical protein